MVVAPRKTVVAALSTRRRPALRARGGLAGSALDAVPSAAAVNLDGLHKIKSGFNWPFIFDLRKGAPIYGKRNANSSSAARDCTSWETRPLIATRDQSLQLQPIKKEMIIRVTTSSEKGAHGKAIKVAAEVQGTNGADSPNS
ncbi:hypothetical protein EJB05_37534 [Eragrostis curvula]|uniref:Uncharacterized protein n=1 Tax=Eragrostis curvula TaxID=38414 RepID=A0A5J9TTE8_9POAL|nr:hypothetical protein EJB05_37534 [Eragrostis curvula]